MERVLFLVTARAEANNDYFSLQNILSQFTLLLTDPQIGKWWKEYVDIESSSLSKLVVFWTHDYLN